MSVAEVLYSMEAAGLELALTAGQLRIRGDRAAYTPELQAEVRVHRSELVALLLEALATAPSNAVAYTAEATAVGTLTAAALLAQLHAHGCTPSLLPVLPGQLPTASRRIAWGSLVRVPAELLHEASAHADELRAELARQKAS